MSKYRKTDSPPCVIQRVSRPRYFFKFFSFFALIVLILTTTTQAKSIQGWVDLAHHTSGEEPFRISIIANNKKPCDCSKGERSYKVRYYHLKGDDAYRWLKKKGLAKKYDHGTWIPTKTYKDWKSLRDNGDLYWQGCRKYCKELESKKNTKNTNEDVIGFWKLGIVGGGPNSECTANLRLDRPQFSKVSNYFKIFPDAWRVCPIADVAWIQQGSSIIIMDSNGVVTGQVNRVKKGYWEGSGTSRNNKRIQIYLKR